jgi:AraC-like DNA-binding protein
MGTEFSPVLHYIRNNYRSLTLTELAEHFHYSKPHLCTLIKQNTGVSFTELVKRLRMTRAEEYLVNTDMNIGSIAASLGYSSTDHFSRVFRKTYGMSPVEYRKANMNSDAHFVPFSYV